MSAASELIERLIDAWNRGDADAFAALFSLDADYVSATGEWRQGREAIRALLGPDRTALRVALEGEVQVRAHGPVSTAIFRWATRTPTGAGRRGVTSCALVEHAQGLLIERLQNTDAAEL